MAFNSLVDNFERDAYAESIDRLQAPARVDYLKRVYTWTFGGLTLAGVSGAAMAGVIAMNPKMWLAGYVPTIVILVCFGIAHYLCASMVAKPSTEKLGFAIANIAEGIALGFLLFIAAVMSKAITGNPFTFIAQALGLTILTVFGVTAYVWTNPSEFRWAQAIVSALFLPMLLIMAISFIAPGLLGGAIGIGISVLFVGVSVLGILLSTRDVLHNLGEDQVIPGAYMLTMGILILFWNLLQLILKLQSRD